jgi:hypothetical protein
VTTPTIDGVIEEALSRVIAERPQLGPFASFLRHATPSYIARGNWDAEKVAALDQEAFTEQANNMKGQLDVEADRLEGDLDNCALLVVLVGDHTGSKAVYPEANAIWWALIRLDQEDIEPACQAFLERVAFHRAMRGDAA